MQHLSPENWSESVYLKYLEWAPMRNSALCWDICLQNGCFLAVSWSWMFTIFLARSKKPVVLNRNAPQNVPGSVDMMESWYYDAILARKIDVWEPVGKAIRLARSRCAATHPLTCSCFLEGSGWSWSTSNSLERLLIPDLSRPQRSDRCICAKNILLTRLFWQQTISVLQYYLKRENYITTNSGRKTRLDLKMGEKATLFMKWFLIPHLLNKELPMANEIISSYPITMWKA